MKATITNTSRALQGVHSTTGLVFIEAGATQEIEVADDYVDRLKSLPFFSLNGKPHTDDEVINGRNADGDTPEMAEMRKQFDVSYGALAKQLKAVADAFGDAGVNESNVDQRVTALIADLNAKDDEIATLKAGGGKPADPPNERDELKKQAGELGIEYAKNISTEKLKELIDAKLAA